MIRFNSRNRSHVLPLLALLLAALLLSGTSRAAAQSGEATPSSEPSAYWQYDAPGPLGLVVVADVDHNGVREFVITTEGYQVVLLSATGEDLWTYQTPNQAAVLQLTTVNVDGRQDPYREILLATEEQLTLLSWNGEIIWERPLVLPPIPTGLLTDTSEEALRRVQRNSPVAVMPFDHDVDGNDAILLLMQSGLVQLYDGDGNYLWQYPDAPPASDAPRPDVKVGDVDRDGIPEILFTYYIRYSRIVLLEGNGKVRWERPLSGRVTSLALVSWDEQMPMDIAVGNSFRGEEKLVERVIVYDHDGQERWYRTPNRTVTALATSPLPQGAALLVGSSAGTITAYSREGFRFWRYIPDSPKRAVISISPSPMAKPQSGQPALAFTLAPVEGNSSEPAAALLLNESGQEMQRFLSASASGQTRLVDINRDGISELMLTSFGTLSLTDPGTGARKNAQVWDYRVSDAPLSMLVADLNADGADELLVGTRDGRIHLLESDTGQASSIINLGGQVNHLALLPSLTNESALIVAAHNHAATTDPNEGQGFLELIQASGRVVWPDAITVGGTITALTVGNVNHDPIAEIVVGTSLGELIVYSIGPRELWRTTVPASIDQLMMVSDDNEPSTIVVKTNQNQIYRFDGTGKGLVLAHYEFGTIRTLYRLPGLPGNDPNLLLVTDEGSLQSLSGPGIEPWRWQLEQGRVAQVQPMGETLLVATNEGKLLNLDVRNKQLLWELDHFDSISALYSGDFDGGGAEDIAVGTRTGKVFLYTSDARLWDSLSLSSSSSVFGLASVQQQPDEQAQLVVITDNGVVQLFEAKPNRPPLLVNPEVEVSPGRYDIRISVVEEEGDNVAIGLQTYDPNTGLWETQLERNVTGRDNLLFPVAPEMGKEVQYRFVFDDGTHQGTFTPAVGPAPQAVSALRATIIGPALIVLAIFSVLTVLRQSVSPEARGRQFYKKLKQQPTATLELLDEQYRQKAGSPDFLLNLANRARLEKNLPLANLTDGLFLLSNRPAAALPILNSALMEAEVEALDWQGSAWWQMMLQAVQALLDAPSVTELSLLYPQLLQLVQFQKPTDHHSLGMDVFLAVLNSLRDSERVDLVEDRIVYLHEASVLLRHIKERLAVRPITIQNQLMGGVQERLLGLVNADMEQLRGQAKLAMSLKTKRVVPEAGQVVIALEIHNSGRAAAENLIVRVEDDPAYHVLSPSLTIPVLAAGRRYVMEFSLEPHVEDRFRAAFSLTYEDRVRRNRELAFADMVYLLPPQRDFTPIANPYLPGTPLRSNSPLFYGRTELFQFIAENAGQLTRRNVLILVGQRRTGKTSALLRLEHHLPDNILPVYIDCQSLGVMPGMAALLHDLAWLIADALANCGYDVDVPEGVAWQNDPARLFRHEFLQSVRRQLRPGTTLMLVFDEFEAFENLVEDDILPSTLFTYMRHLMQHSEGLSFVFVGTRRLEEMSTDYWSVLFNIALYRQIGFLSEEAALQLITEPVAPQIIYDDLALDKIWRVTAGHPYFLQLVCYTLVKRANSRGTGYVTISDVNAALEEMLRLGEVHFAYLWQRSTYTERALLAAVAHLMERDVPFHPADLIQYLEQYGFRFDPADVTAGLDRLVEREIMREITDEGTTLYELKIGLVGLWAAQNKSLSKLYESRNGESLHLAQRHPERT